MELNKISEHLGKTNLKLVEHATGINYLTLLKWRDHQPEITRINDNTYNKLVAYFENTTPCHSELDQKKWLEIEKEIPFALRPVKQRYDIDSAGLDWLKVNRLDVYKQVVGCLL